MTRAPESDRSSDRRAASVVSVNVGGIRTVALNGRPVRTAIWKAPVAGPVAVRGVTLAGDRQADRSVHGGPDKAVYAYAAEDLAWWAGVLGRPMEPGTFGENLTMARIDPAEGQPAGPKFGGGVPQRATAFPARSRRSSTA